VKPDVVVVNGKEERHAEGSYYISWYEQKKLVRRSVGKDTQDASFQRSRKKAELNAAHHGIETQQTSPQNGSSNGHKALASAVSDYLEEIKLTKKPRAAGRPAK
jgi:hypothetical protein